MLRGDGLAIVGLALLCFVEYHFNFLGEDGDFLVPVGLGFLSVALFLFWKMRRLSGTEPEGKEIGGD